MLLLFLLLKMNYSTLNEPFHSSQVQKPMEASWNEFEAKTDCAVNDEECELKSKEVIELELFDKIENLVFKKNKKPAFYFRNHFLALTGVRDKFFSIKERRTISSIMNIIINMDYNEVTQWKKQVELYENINKSGNVIVSELNDFVEKYVEKFKLTQIVPLESDDFTVNLVIKGLKFAFEFKLFVELDILSEEYNEYIKLIDLNLNKDIDLLQQLRTADNKKYNEVTGSFNDLYEFLNENVDEDFKVQRKHLFSRHFAMLNNSKYTVILLERRAIITEYAIRKMVSNAESIKLALYMMLNAKYYVCLVYKYFFDFDLFQNLPNVNENEYVLKQLVCLYSIFSVYKEQEKLVLEKFPKELILYIGLKKIEIENEKKGRSNVIMNLDECLSNLFCSLLLFESLMEERDNGSLSGYEDKISELLFYIKQHVYKMYFKIGKCSFLRVIPIE